MRKLKNLGQLLVELVASLEENMEPEEWQGESDKNNNR